MQRRVSASVVESPDALKSAAAWTNSPSWFGRFAWKTSRRRRGGGGGGGAGKRRGGGAAAGVRRSAGVESRGCRTLPARRLRAAGEDPRIGARIRPPWHQSRGGS